MGEAEEINAYLRSLGGTDEQIASAWSDCHIARLAGDLVFEEGATLTAQDVTDVSGTPVEQVLSLWRTLGIVVPGADHPMFSDARRRFHQVPDPDESRG